MAKKELDLMTRRKVLVFYRRRYREAKSKKEKSQILDGFVSLTQYNRSYASWLLRRPEGEPKGDYCWSLCSGGVKRRGRVNYFQPSVKLVSKTRVGSRVKRSMMSPRPPMNPQTTGAPPLLRHPRQEASRS